MKKVKRVSFKANPTSEILEKFKPLYLLSTKNQEQSDQVCIFISRCEKNCYIQEKGNWNQLIIEDLLLTPIGKTYCFPIKNIYRYLDIPYQSPPYLTLTKNTKHKIFLKNLELSEEILQELALPNLEQLDRSMLPKTKLEAGEILRLETQMNEINAKLNELNDFLLICKEAKEAMKKLESDEKDPFTLEDIKDQIKLISRQIYSFRHLKSKKEVKRETILTNSTLSQSELYEQLLTLRTKEKEANRDIENLESAINALKNMAEMFIKNPKNFNFFGEDLLIEIDIKRKIQLISNKNSEVKAKLEKIKANIKILKEPKLSQDVSLVEMSQVKHVLFNLKAENKGSTKAQGTEFKSFTL